MFEKEIKFIADFNLNKVKSLGSFITFEKLRGSTIHPAIIQYISAELDYLISEDRNRLLQESVFDYTGAEASKYFNLIAQEVKKNKKISFEDLKNLVIQAVSFNLNYLARPKWSLSKLIYNDDQSRSIEEIKLNLNYIYFYDYIKSIFFSYISKRKLTTLSITEFELILNKIDNELFAAQPQKLVDYSLYSMAEFFNLGDVNKTKISVLILELFFKEKNLMDYLFRLRKAAPDDTNPKFDIDDIKNIIYSTAPVEAGPIVPKEEVAEPEKSPKAEEIIPDDEVKKDEEFVLPLPEVTEPVFAPELPELEFIAEEAVKDAFEEKNDEEKTNEEISELLTEEEVPEQKIEEDFVEEEIEEKTEEKIEEKAEEIEIPEEEIKIPEPEEPAVIEIADEEIELVTETEEENIIPEAARQEEDTKEENIIAENAASLSDEDFFSLFNDEVKKIEENDADLNNETDELKTEAEKKADVDSFFDFEEETENLLRAFKETEDEMNSKDIELFQDTSSQTEKAAMDLIKDFHNEGDEKDSVPPVKANNNEKPVKRNGKYKEKKIRNILDSISNNDVEKIISNVFNDDRKDFTDTMARLNECANYDEATEILKGVFLTYRVNPYTKDALTLTNSVANYFTQV
jgi:hypothetical protein